MPNFGLKLHDWRSERVVCGNLDVDLVSTAFVRGIWGTWEDSSQVRHIILAADGLRRDLRVCVGMDISQFLGNTPRPITSHSVLQYWTGTRVFTINEEICVV